MFLPTGILATRARQDILLTPREARVYGRSCNYDIISIDAPVVQEHDIKKQYHECGIQHKRPVILAVPDMCYVLSSKTAAGLKGGGGVWSAFADQDTNKDYFNAATGLIFRRPDLNNIRTRLTGFSPRQGKTRLVVFPNFRKVKLRDHSVL